MNSKSIKGVKNIEGIQQDFIDAIFGGDKEPAASHVVGDEKLTAQQRLGIYKGSVHGILTQSLGITFSVCKALVGDDFFDKMTTLFVNKYPPMTTYFVEYGDKFPEFIENFEHTKSLPYLRDLTQLEWARQYVWHQQQAEPFDFSALAELTEEQQAKLSFNLKKTIHLIQSDYRIDDIWFAHQEGSNISFEDIKLDEAVKLILWKSDNEIKITLMNQNEADSLQWDFLQSLSQDATITDLAIKYTDRLPELLNMSIQSGWIESFKIN
jgi:hypothetical protein